MTKQHQLAVEEVPFELIMREGHGMFNCRGDINVESPEFKELLDDIRKNGITTPPMVWAVPGTGSEDTGEDLVLLAGYRRHLAMTILRQKAIEKGTPADKLPFANLNVAVFHGNPSEALARNLADNLRHEDVNPADKCSHIAKLHEALSADAGEAKWTQAKTASVLNCGQPFVAQCLGIERYCSSDVKAALRAGHINFSHARTLSNAEFRKTDADGNVGPDVEKQALELANIMKGEGIKLPKKSEDKVPKTQDFVTKANIIALMQRAEEMKQMAERTAGDEEPFVYNEQRMNDLEALYGLLFLTQSPSSEDGEDRVAVNIDAYLCGTQNTSEIETGLQSVREEIEGRTKKAAERLAKEAEKAAAKLAREEAKAAAAAAKAAAADAGGETPKKKRRTAKKKVEESAEATEA